MIAASDSAPLEQDCCSTDGTIVLLQAGCGAKPVFLRRRPKFYDVLPSIFQRVCRIRAKGKAAKKNEKLQVHSAEGVPLPIRANPRPRTGRCAAEPKQTSDAQGPTERT